jgi:diguanylate cyclase (GGDEF)-like protein/PAS domain S-box-containing protein
MNDWVDCGPAFLTIVAVRSGVMEAKRDVAETGPSRAALEHLTETVPAIVYIAEMGSSGRWLYVSSQIKTLLGYEPEEWMSDPDLWYRSLHPDDVETAMAWEGHSPDGTEVVPSVEYRMRTKDGRYVTIYECTRLVEDPEGGDPLWHGVITDISALKEAETAAARRAEQQALTARIGAAAFTIKDQQKMLELTMETLLGLDGIIEAEVWQYIDGDRVALRYRTGYEGPPLVNPNEPDRYPGTELNAGRTVVIDDWDHDEKMRPYIQHRNPEVMSTIIVPVIGIERQFGFVALNSSVRGRFSSEDEDFLLAATSLLGSTIDRNRVEMSLRHRLLHDSLTELPNRDLFNQRLKQAMESATSSRHKAAVLFLDIDHFKLINDGIGHHFGDEALKEVGQRLMGELARDDTVARFGGDEFVIVLASVSDVGQTVTRAEGLLDLLADPIRFDDSDVVIAASIGVALFDPSAEPDKTAETLVREANAAMHEAKALGRAQVHLFDQPLKNSALNRLNTESGLRAAIEREELLLHYQPLVALPGRRIIGFESLVRWQHPDRGLIGPDEFIPVAEESGLISQIDSWVLEEASRQIADWGPIIGDDRNFGVSVNVSARQLSLSGLEARVASVLKRHEIAAEKLVIEITEGALVSGSSSIVDVLDAIRALGVRLSLDDFGTGFSSLSQLSRYPFDSIKIDRSFIEQLASGDPAGSAITDAVLRIGDALSMTVVAEGVSTQTELEMIQQRGCQIVQGYVISRPVTAATATRMLRTGAVPEDAADWSDQVSASGSIPSRT